MPWADDGGNSWNAHKCSPLDPNPKEVGDRCTVERNGVSGVDDCDVASMCWDVDPETNTGVCVAFCFGSAANPQCAELCHNCVIANDGILTLCLLGCDPLLQDCPEGQGCFPNSGEFICAPDPSGPDLGVYGDPCEFINACDPGLWCAPPEQVPNCQGTSGCCTYFCDLDNPECPDPDLGVECVPWFDEDEAAPPCVTSAVGSCLIP